MHSIFGSDDRRQSQARVCGPGFASEALRLSAAAYRVVSLRLAERGTVEKYGGLRVLLANRYTQSAPSASPLPLRYRTRRTTTLRLYDNLRHHHSSNYLVDIVIVMSTMYLFYHTPVERVASESLNPSVEC